MLCADHRAVAWALMQRAEKRRRIDVPKNDAAGGSPGEIGRFWDAKSRQVWWMNGGYIIPMMFIFIFS